MIFPLKTYQTASISVNIYPSTPLCAVWIKIIVQSECALEIYGRKKGKEEKYKVVSDCLKLRCYFSSSILISFV